MENNFKRQKHQSDSDPATRRTWLATFCLEQLLACCQFLRNHSSSSNHSKAAIVKFLVLQLKEFLFIRGSQVERVKVEIAWYSTWISHLPPRAKFWCARVRSWNVSEGKDRENLGDGDRGQDNDPKFLQRSLLER